MRIITVADVEYLAFRLAQEGLSFDEPIPDFSTRVPNVLESVDAGQSDQQPDDCQPEAGPLGFRIKPIC